MNSKPLARPGRLTVLLGLLALLGLVGSALLGLRWHDLNVAAATRSEVVAEARELALTVTAYDYREIDDYFAGLQEASTGEFATNFQSATPELRDVVVSTESVVTATVTQAGLTSLTDDRAVVLLFVDQEVSNKALAEPRVDRNRMVLTLELEGDRWRISALEIV